MRSSVIVLAIILQAARMTAQTPTQTVANAFAAFGRGDWQQLATLIHPQALAAFRTQQLGSAIGTTLLRNDPATRGRNVGFSPANFLTPDAIRKAKDLRVGEFPGSPTVGELASLSPAEFFVRWCEAAFHNRAESPWAATQHVGRQIIGEVMEGDTLAHVLYRLEGESVWLAGKLDVMPLKQSDGRWLMLLNDDIIWRFPLVRGR